MVSPTHLVRYTYADYLRVEEDSQHVRHEFLGGEIFAMAGGTPEHARMAAAIIGVLSQALRGKSCTVFTSDLRVRIDALDVTTYPDVSVICGPIQHSTIDPLAATNPTLLVEVTSDSTEAYDRSEKLSFYFALPTVREVLIISHREPRITLCQRDANEFRTKEFVGSGASVTLESIGAKVDLVDVFGRP
jgi:Uma2 family endonuclease